MAKIETKWLPVSEVRKMLGVSRQRVYELIGVGRIASVKMGLTVMVSRETVERYIAERKGRSQ